MPKQYEPIPLEFTRLSERDMVTHAQSYYRKLKKRRSVRDFTDRPIPQAVIKNAIRAAGTAPNGANMQPWHFVAISNKEIKHAIRVAAEKEEKEFYENKATDEWLGALSHLGTDAHKPFLDTASHLIVIFQKKFTIDEEGNKLKNYYSSESVGIATGFLIDALFQSGVATLTHTPNPMKFLNEILDRPSDEKPFMILVAGYPVKNCKVPTIEKKPLNEIATFFD